MIPLSHTLLVKENPQIVGLIKFQLFVSLVQYWSHQSFRGSVVSEAGSKFFPLKAQTLPTTSETPPKVPPRRESISPQLVKPELPFQLISTSNQVLKPATVQQQIPTKLAALSKGKGSKMKSSHQRTHSAGTDTGLFSKPLEPNKELDVFV